MPRDAPVTQGHKMVIRFRRTEDSERREVHEFWFQCETCQANGLKYDSAAIPQADLLTHLQYGD